jgi:hypothetical protein
MPPTKSTHLYSTQEVVLNKGPGYGELSGSDEETLSRRCVQVENKVRRRAQSYDHQV